MALVQPSLLEQLEQRKETAEAHARKQRMAALLQRLKQQWEPLRQATLRRP